MEIKTARNWYWWLWLSPFVTTPTLLMLYDQDIEYAVRHVVGWGRYTLPIVVILLLSALWHLLLLVPTLNKTSDFVRWHGRQALVLAGIRTAVPICMVLLTGDEYGVLYAIPILILIWLIGTVWGQRQAARGDCSLMRWFGQAEALPCPEPVQDIDQDPDALVDVIRFSHDPQQRRAALMELEKLGMVERLDGAAITTPISTPLSTTKDKIPFERSGGGYALLIVVLVLAALLGVSGGSKVYRGRSTAATAATRQAYGTATIIAGVNATATAQGRQSVKDTASRWPLVLQSSFESIQNPWHVGEEESEWLSGNRRISNGMYLWDAQAKDGSIWWSIPKTDRMFFDFFLTVESKRVIGPMDNEYGVVFRYIDANNFYDFKVIDNNSKARVRAQYKGDWVGLALFNATSIIRPGEVNRLTVVGEGPNITFFINDQYAGELEDNTFGYGEAGLAISLDDGDYGRFSFDNFEIRAPVPEAGEQNRLNAIKFVNSGVIRARQGDIEDALTYYAEAQAIDPYFEISANSWNYLCWFGSLWGYAAEVMEACETAVALDPEHGGIRDSRGVARAITGDYTGAIEDFTFFVEWLNKNEEYGFWSQIQEREAWIIELENGRNPFDAELLESLKQE